MNAIKLAIRFQSLIFALLFSLGLAAQGCPDVGVVVLPETLVAGPAVPCGIGLEITIGGVHYQSKQGFCPTFVDTIPEHHVGSRVQKGYRYVYERPLDVVRQIFNCNGWFWTSCDRGTSSVIYTVNNYIDVPCEAEAEAVVTL